MSAAASLVPYETAVEAGILSEDWYQGRGVYGGMVAAILQRAMQREAGQLPIRSVHVSFCAPATAGPADITTRILRQGRSVTQCEAQLSRTGDVIASATATFARARASKITFAETEMPAMPNPADMPQESDELYIPEFCKRHLEFRHVSGPAPFTGADQANIAGWCRLRSAPAVVSADLLTALLDAWPPAALGLYPEWAPAASIDMRVHFFESAMLERLSPEMHFGFEARCTRADDGYADEEATLFSQDGTALAAARQLVALFA